MKKCRHKTVTTFGISHVISGPDQLSCSSTLTPLYLRHFLTTP